MKRSIALAFSACALVACASHTEVIRIGADRYMVGYQEKGKFDSWTEIKANAVKLADDYCSAQSASLEVIEIKTSGVRGWTPQGAEVTFRCASKPQS